MSVRYIPRCSISVGRAGVHVLNMTTIQLIAALVSEPGRGGRWQWPCNKGTVAAAVVNHNTAE